MLKYKTFMIKGYEQYSLIKYTYLQRCQGVKHREPEKLRIGGWGSIPMYSVYNINKGTTLKKEKIVLLCLMVLIILIHIRKIEMIGTFIMLDDEFGYWGVAAYLAGLNWSNIVSQIPYYSYGYSLLLVPLFWIFDNPMHMYKAAIVLNGIMLSISFLLCYDIARKLMNNVNKYILIGISFIISMYPAYIVYSSIAWSECLLILVCWLIAWSFVNLNKNSSIYRFILIGFLSGYVYIIHQRSLGVLVASISVIIIMKIFNKINFKHLLGVFLPIIVLAIIHIYLKDNIQSNLWLNSFGNLANDYTGVFYKIGQLFSIKGSIMALNVFIGQFFYLGAASYLIFYFGLYELIKENLIKTIFSKRIDNTTIYDGKSYFCAFLLIALVISIAISVIFFINPNRIDQIVYGRYTEMIMGPVLLLGFLRIIDKGIPLIRLLLLIVGFSSIAIIANIIINQSELSIFCTAHSVGLAFMNTSLGLVIPVLMGILGCMLIIRSFNNKKTIIITIITIASLFFFTGEIVVKSMVGSHHDKMEIMKIVNPLTTIEENTPIYLLVNSHNNPVYDKWDSNKGGNRFNAEQYQFLLKDKIIKLVNKEELVALPIDKYVIAEGSIDLSCLQDDYKTCVHAVGDYLLVSKSIELGACQNEQN